jgi:hypothetical protein
VTVIAAGQKLALTLVLPAGNFPVSGTVITGATGHLSLMLSGPLLLNGKAFWNFVLTGPFAYTYKNVTVLA